MVLTGAFTSDCAHRSLAVNAPDWGLAHRFLVGIAVQGTEIFQVQFDVASSTAACYYGLWLSLVLTGNPTPGPPSERGLHAEVAGGLVV